MPTNRYRIESDGTAIGTKIIDLKSGLPLEYVKSVQIFIDATRPGPVVILELVNVEISCECSSDEVINISSQREVTELKPIPQDESHA